MKKIIIVALIVFALFRIGENNKNESAPSKTDGANYAENRKEKMEYFIERTYDGLAVCVSFCRELASDIMS